MTPSEITYALHALAWSGIGYLGGYVVGRIGSDVHLVKETVVPHSETPTGTWPLLRRRTDGRTVAFGAFLVALAGLTVILSAISLVRLESVTRCQARYAERAADATTARTLAAEGDREALNRLVRDVGTAVANEDPDARRAQVRTALGRYNDATADGDRQRAAEPFPAPPSEVCR